MDERANEAVDFIPALVSTLDASLHYEALNAQHRTWLGMDPDAARGRMIWDVVHPAFRAALEPVALRALAGETVDCELEMPPGIATRWVRVTITPERGADGAVARIHCLVIDLGRERALARSLARSEATFNAAFDAAGVGKALARPDGVIAQMNAAFAGMLGYRPADLEGRHFADFTHPDDLAADVDLFEALKRGEIPNYRLEKRYIARNGRSVDALLTVSVGRREDGTPGFYVAEVVDIRDRKTAERQVRERNAHLGLALEMIDGGVWHHDLRTGLVRLSGDLARSIGLRANSRVALQTLMGRIHPDDRADVEAVMQGGAARPGAIGVFRIRSSGCGWLWFRWRHRLTRDAHGTPESLLGVVVDVTEEQQREAALTREAHSDALTGLTNRRGFDIALRDATAGGGGALLLIDLDRFKPINDAYGHAMGDRVLCEVARRLRATVRAHDTVARLGGDEFAVLLPNIARDAAEQAAQRIVAALGVPWRSGAMVAQTGASVGVVVATPGDDHLTLMKRADDALYEVKRAGRGAWRLAA